MDTSRSDKITTFTDLEVWKRSHKLTLSIYLLTRGFPSEEKFGLVSQMRRAAVSVPANIAEGFYRRTKRDKTSFYTIALVPLHELRYYLILSKDLKYMESNKELLEDVKSVGMMLNKLISTVLA